MCGIPAGCRRDPAHIWSQVELVPTGRSPAAREPDRQLGLVSGEHRHREHPRPGQQLVHPS
ncbi:MAG: hypothetical protein ACRDYA_25180, partial [Egibacteraceae bacterium]